MDMWKLFKVNKPKHDTAVVVLVENQGELSTRIGYYRPNQVWRDRCNNRIQGVVAWWKPPTTQAGHGAVRWNFEHDETQRDEVHESEHSTVPHTQTNVDVAPCGAAAWPTENNLW